MSIQIFLVAVIVLISGSAARIVNKFKCPEVRAVPHFDLQQMLGDWYVVEYYASAEEALSYSCMKSVFAQDDHVPAAGLQQELPNLYDIIKATINFDSLQYNMEITYIMFKEKIEKTNRDPYDWPLYGGWTPGVTMNFTYRFADDPLGENLFGNITWRVDLNQPAHWTHAESTYDGIYNTYVLDTEYKTWSLLLHCAEPKDKARYLSAFILSRKTTLPKNVMAYLRDKLPRYDVDMNYVFAIPHDDCKDKPARADYSPVLVPVDSKKPQKPGLAYNVDVAKDN